MPLFYENRTPELQLVNPDLNHRHGPAEIYAVEAGRTWELYKSCFR